jgi:aminoglycoside phosphotransferase (APT) family kinase protein
LAESKYSNRRKSCLIHNDYRFDNVILDAENPMKIIGVLDWEMATIGDPMMDLGNTLAYWVQADDDFMAKSTRRQPTHLKRHAYTKRSNKLLL